MWPKAAMKQVIKTFEDLFLLELMSNRINDWKFTVYIHVLYTEEYRTKTCKQVNDIP